MMRDYDHWVVWIGPVEDAHYRTKDEARGAAQRRRSEGWNDVRIEKIYYDERSWTV